MKVSINGVAVGDFIHVRKVDKEFKGYVVEKDELFYRLSVLVTDTIKGSPFPIEEVNQDDMLDAIEALFSSLEDSKNEFSMKEKIYKNVLAYLSLSSLLALVAGSLLYGATIGTILFMFGKVMLQEVE